jgi:hypothetical protein
LGETEDKSKPKEKRIEEKEKLEAEVERSLAVARMKEAHMKIEDIEKVRKRSALLSVRKRIANTMTDFTNEAKILNETESTNLAIDPRTEAYLLDDERTYRSVRADFQKTLEIKDEDMKKLFPEIEIERDTSSNAGTSLLCIVYQLADMNVYCERMLT